MEGIKLRLAQRRRQFLDNTAVKLTEIELLLNELPNTPADGDVLAQLNRFFHQLAGAGGIYEMEEFCRITIAAEDLCVALIGAGHPIPESAQKQLREYCKALADTTKQDFQAF